MSLDSQDGCFRCHFLFFGGPDWFARRSSVKTDVCYFGGVVGEITYGGAGDG